MTDPKTTEHTSGGLIGKATGKAKELAGETLGNDEPHRLRVACSRPRATPMLMLQRPARRQSSVRNRLTSRRSK